MRPPCAAAAGIAAALALAGCRRPQPAVPPPPAPPPTTAAAGDAAAVRTMEVYFAEGLKRPYGPAGPRFELPRSYYAHFAAHPAEAGPFLEGKLRSTQGTERANTFDIVIHLERFPSTREWASATMSRVADDGSPLRFMLPAHEEARQRSPASRPDPGPTTRDLSPPSADGSR